MHVTVLFLGPARDLAGRESAGMELADGATLATLRTALLADCPGLRGAIGTMRFAVDRHFASEETRLHAGQEVALIPPVSGGSDDGVLVEFVRAELDSSRYRTHVSGDPSFGGISIFEGVTRAETDPAHGRLVHLDYEAYEEMATERMYDLALDAKGTWSAGRLAMAHRLGRVRPGEASVVIAVACGHREQSFAACRWLIDTLKRDVPVWKKEVYADGHTHWVEGEAALR